MPTEKDNLHVVTEAEEDVEKMGAIETEEDPEKINKPGKKGGFSPTKKDNIALTKKIKELMKSEKQMMLRSQLLAVDNSRLISEIDELKKENTMLSTKYNEADDEYQTVSNKLDALMIENSKTQEIAIEIQNIKTSFALSRRSGRSSSVKISGREL